MKKHITTALLSLMIMFFGYGYAQKANNQSEPGIDRNTSLKQQLAVLNAGKDNPVHATPVERDARMSEEMEATEADFGPSNDKAEPISGIDERALDNASQVSVAQNTNAITQPAAGSNTQPLGATPENVINYRNINGPNTQPQAEESGNVINYRSIKGSNEQPEGDAKDPEK